MPVNRTIMSPGITGNITAFSGSFDVVEKFAWRDTNDRLAEIFPRNAGTELDPFFGIYRAAAVQMRALGSEPKQLNKVPSTIHPGVTIPEYEFMVFTITYSSDENIVSGDEGSDPDQDDPTTNLTHTWTVGGEVISMDNAEMRWSQGQAAKAHASAANANFIIPTIEHSITWHRVARPPFEAIRSLIGKVNLSTMQFATGGGILPETLLFLGADLSREILSNGDRAWKLGYKFSERRVDSATHDGVSYYKRSDGVYVANDTEYTTLPIIPVYSPSSFAAAYIGGWNHFFRNAISGPIVANPLAINNAPAGFFRLHRTDKKPPKAGQYLFYDDDLAVFKKREFQGLFAETE